MSASEMYGAPMNRMMLLPMILLAQPAATQSLRERIEAEATEIVGGMLSDAIESTLISEGRKPEFAACVGQIVAEAFEEATDEQREASMRAWIDAGKRRCELILASTNSSSNR